MTTGASCSDTGISILYNDTGTLIASNRSEDSCEDVRTFVALPQSDAQIETDGNATRGSFARMRNSSRLSMVLSSSSNLTSER